MDEIPISQISLAVLAKETVIGLTGAACAASFIAAVWGVFLNIVASDLSEIFQRMAFSRARWAARHWAKDARLAEALSIQWSDFVADCPGALLKLAVALSFVAGVLSRRLWHGAQAKMTGFAEWLAGVTPVSPLARRRLIAAAASIVVMAATTIGLVPVASQPFLTSPMQLDAHLPTESARARLMELVNALAGASVKHRDGDGTTFVHLQRWALNLERPTAVPVAQDWKLWRYGDGSIRTVQTSLSAEWAWGPIDEHAESQFSLPIVRDFPPGTYPLLISEPSAEPPILAGQLNYLATRLDHAEPIGNGPQTMLRSVASVAEQNDLSTDQRVALLEVLANADGLTYRGTEIDRAGRPSLAFTVDAGSPGTMELRDMLLIDQADGRILEYRQVVLFSASPAIPANTIGRYTVFLT